jgi:hypothetical protein
MEFRFYYHLRRYGRLEMVQYEGGEYIPIVVYFWNRNIAVSSKVSQRSSFACEYLFPDFHWHEWSRVWRSKDPSYAVFEGNKDRPVETSRGRPLGWIFSSCKRLVWNFNLQDVWASARRWFVAYAAVILTNYHFALACSNDGSKARI